MGLRKRIEARTRAATGGRRCKGERTPSLDGSLLFSHQRRVTNRLSKRASTVPVPVSSAIHIWPAGKVVSRIDATSVSLTVAVMVLPTQLSSSRLELFPVLMVGEDRQAVSDVGVPEPELELS